MAGDVSRQNGTRSSGPRTSEGKARSRYNGTRHNLYTRASLITVGPMAEDARELQAHRRAMWEDLQPVGYLEEVFADRIADLTWRLRRASRAEASVLALPESPQHSPGCQTRKEATELLALLGPSCNCGAEEAQRRASDLSSRNRLPAERLAALDAVMATEAHLTRELGRTWAMLLAARQSRRTREHVPMLGAGAISGTEPESKAPEAG